MPKLMNLNEAKEKITDKIVTEVISKTDLLDIVESNFRPIQRLMTTYSCAIMEIETKLKVLDAELSLEYDRNPIESIKSRVKSIDSIKNKLVNKNLQLNIGAIEKNLNDVAGVRVICSYVDDIYDIAHWLLSQDDIKLIKRKDYINTPKPNGYRSLHLIVAVPVFLMNEKKWVKVEVQLRTIAMDFWASLEHKAHYKKDIPEEIEAEIYEELRTCAEISAKLDLRMDTVKKRISEF